MGSGAGRPLSQLAWQVQLALAGTGNETANLSHPQASLGSLGDAARMLNMGGKR